MTFLSTPPDPQARLRTSEVLMQAALNHSSERITLEELIDRLGERTYGLLLLVLALPNAVGIGLVPGVGTVSGALMILVTAQMIAGMPRPWLPAAAKRKSFARAELEHVVTQAKPYLERIERVLKPRWVVFTLPWIERLLGVLFFLLALPVFLPIPFSNWLPAVVMLIAALGLLEQDGLVLTLSMVLSLAAMTLVTRALIALAHALV